MAIEVPKVVAKKFEQRGKTNRKMLKSLDGYYGSWKQQEPTRLRLFTMHNLETSFPTILWLF